MERTLDADRINTDPVAYLIDLATVAEDAVTELRDALTRQDTRVVRFACLRMQSIGALAGIVGRKLDAE